MGLELEMGMELEMGIELGLGSATNILNFASKFRGYFGST